MSTAPAVDERSHSTVVIAAIDAALTARRAELAEHVFDFGSVPGEDGNPGTPPETYVAIAIERRFVPKSRMVGIPSRTGWRISARYVARTVNNARLAALAVSDAFDGQQVVVDGVTSTRIQLESTTSIIPDAGMFSGLSVWTYGM